MGWVVISLGSVMMVRVRMTVAMVTRIRPMRGLVVMVMIRVRMVKGRLLSGSGMVRISKGKKRATVLHERVNRHMTFIKNRLSCL